MFPIYIEALIKMVSNLNTTLKNSRQSKVTFASDTALFISNSLSNEGIQSMIDFVNHSHSPKQLDIYTITTNQKNIDLLSRNIE